VTESRRYLLTGTPLGDVLETTGHGTWKKGSGRNTFDAFFLILLQNSSTGAALAPTTFAFHWC